MVCSQIWKWYAVKFGNGVQSNLEMVLSQIWKWYAVKFGNGLQSNLEMICKFGYGMQ